jgi:hypothetical protein
MTFVVRKVIKTVRNVSLLVRNKGLLVRNRGVLDGKHLLLVAFISL